MQNNYSGLINFGVKTSSSETFFKKVPDVFTPKLIRPE